MYAKGGGNALYIAQQIGAGRWARPLSQMWSLANSFTTFSLPEASFACHCKMAQQPSTLGYKLEAPFGCLAYAPAKKDLLHYPVGCYCELSRQSLATVRAIIVWRSSAYCQSVLQALKHYPLDSVLEVFGIFAYLHWCIVTGCSVALPWPACLRDSWIVTSLWSEERVAVGIMGKVFTFCSWPLLDIMAPLLAKWYMVLWPP